MFLQHLPTRRTAFDQSHIALPESGAQFSCTTTLGCKAHIGRGFTEVAALTRPNETVLWPGHIDRVHAIVDGRASPQGELDVSASWQRCITRYGLDPGAAQPAQILTSAELKHQREPLDRLIHCAAEELDRLHKVVGQARYVVLLCNREGVAIDYRANPADAPEFKQWGIYPGSIWSEDAEGTNGIGTSITEHRAVTVHRAQHFRARHISLSCSSAPILDADGTLIAVLDVSCFDPTLSERAHALTGALVKMTARAIEERIANEGATWWRTKPSYHRGGLSLGALKRVQEHVERHLADRLSIEQLATVAGLSAFHFARAFKQSQGMTPHNYLLHCRIQRAQELLSATECSLSEVALASGFCDQSHFARHFRQRVGIPPRVYRCSQR